MYSKDATAASVLTGVYTIMNGSSFTYYSAAISFVSGLSSDELNLLDLADTDYSQVFNYSFVQPYDNMAANFWNLFYPIIYTTNGALEGLTASNSLTPAVKQQLLGEARFVRAFCYFYLVNFYGDIPLALTTDYKVNALLPRTAKIKIYQQIISDLKEAVSLLSSNYVGSDAISTGGSVERVRPSKWAAAALLARAYLYTADYPNAETQASLVINNVAQFQLETLDNVFIRGSKEIIWALQVINSDASLGANTLEGRTCVLPVIASQGGTFAFDLDSNFVEQFEDSDQRAIHWIGRYSDKIGTYYYPYKYKIGIGVTKSKEYPVLIRLGELYLIRAEARIHQGNIHNGISDLNVLRTRASDFTTDLADQLPQLPLDVSRDQALHMLEYERMAELFTEMGHRWFDLKRTPGFSNSNTSRADEIMSAAKGSTWKNWAQLYPIPSEELRRAPNLTGHQNPGYQQ